ncbi:hypothetical protein Tco_0336390 [Tanacetum coccineum]
MGEGSLNTNCSPSSQTIIQHQTFKTSGRKQSKRITKIFHCDPQSSGPIEHIEDEVANDENVPTQSNDPPLSRVNTLGNEQEVEVEKVVSTAEVTTKSATTTIDELTLAQTLIEIKAAKPKVRGVMIQEPIEFTTTTTTTTPAASKPSHDKGKAKMIEFDESLKDEAKDQSSLMI